MAQTRMNGMMMEGPAGISPEKVLGSQFATMYTEVAYQAAAFAGLTFSLMAFFPVRSIAPNEYCLRIR